MERTVTVVMELLLVLAVLTAKFQMPDQHQLKIVTMVKTINRKNQFSLNLQKIFILTYHILTIDTVWTVKEKKGRAANNLSQIC